MENGAESNTSYEFPETYVKGFHDDEAVKKMKYSYLGDTGLKVSVLGFGAAPFAGFYSTVSEQDAISSIRTALINGVNYIDTAPWYGKSEEILGKALKGIPREAYYIATKVGRYEPEITKMFDFSEERILGGFDESLRKLGLSYIDVIQVHDVEFSPSPEIILNEALPAVRKIQESGRARFIGITGYPINELREIYMRSTVKIDIIQSYCHLTLNDTSLLDHFEFIEERGVGLINASPVAMGMFTHNGPPTWHPASDELRQAVAKAAHYCKEQGVDLPKLAISFTLSRDEKIPMTLTGMSSVLEVENNLDVLNQGLTAKENEVLEYVLKNFIHPVKENSWEGKELAVYWTKLKAAQTDVQQELWL